MEKFVLVPEACPVVSMTSTVVWTFGPALSEEYSPVVLAGGGGGAVAVACPLAVVESDTARVSVLPMVESDTVRVSVLPFAGSELPAVFFGKVALDVVCLGVGPPCLQLDSEEILLVLLDERGEMSCTVPGVTPDGGPVEGAPVLEPIEHSVLGKSLDGGLQERMLVLEPLEHSVPVITWIDEPLEGTEEILSVLLDERGEMSCTVPGVTPDGGPVEGAPVLEPIEHSVLGKSLDGGQQERMLVLEPLEHSVPVITWIDGPLEGTPVLEPIEHSVLRKSLDGGLQERMLVLEPLEHSVPVITWIDGPLEGTPVLEPLEHSVLEKSSHDEPMEGAPVLEPLEHSVLKKPLDGTSLEGISVVDWFVRLVMGPLEHSVLATTSVWEPLEHSDCVVTDHVDLDYLWMAPWDAGGMLGDSCRPSVATWRTVFRSVVRLSRRPAFVDKDCLRLFRSLGRMCVLDVHVGQTEVPMGSLGDDPKMNLPRSLMSPSDGRVLLSLSVPPMGNSSRRRGSAGNGHSPGMALMTAMCFPRRSSTPGEMCAVELDSMTAMSFTQTSSTPGEMCAV